MDKIKKLLEKEIVRYVIAGGATTVVNIVSFYLLRLFTDLSRSVANIIAISLAILFAFFANKFFVFTESSKKRCRNADTGIYLLCRNKASCDAG